MRKVASGLMLCLALALAGCGRAEPPVVLFPESTDTVEVFYQNAYASELTWELESGDIETVKEWAEALKLELQGTQEDRAPDGLQAEGGNSYCFTVNDGESTFSYINAAGSYILLDDQWYQVENPSDPPVEIPVQEEAAAEIIPMVMVDGKLYYDTGEESPLQTRRCGTMDGEITSAVDRNETPSQENQSNFGTGFGYQYADEDTIEIFINEKWMVFAHREGSGSQIRLGERMIDADSLSEDTIEWIAWYNALPREEQRQVDAVPPELTQWLPEES